jgi:HAE1 family hydrophobic/amphiphilic exporter-1
VVIVQFNLDIDGRKAAEDVREKVALVKPAAARRGQGPRVSRFDPASQPICRGVLSPDGSVAAGADHLGHQVLQKRLENVRGVGSVSVVGGVQREINIYVKPAAMEALGVGVDQVWPRCAARTRNCRWAPSARRARARGAGQRAHEVAGGLPRHRRGPPRRHAGQAVAGGRRGRRPAGVESLALYNGQRTVLLSVQKSQGENTIAVVDGLRKALAELRQGRCCRRA